MVPPSTPTCIAGRPGRRVACRSVATVPRGPFGVTHRSPAREYHEVWMIVNPRKLFGMSPGKSVPTGVGNPRPYSRAVAEAAVVSDKWRAQAIRPHTGNQKKLPKIPTPAHKLAVHDLPPLSAGLTRRQSVAHDAPNQHLSNIVIKIWHMRTNLMELPAPSHQEV